MGEIAAIVIQARIASDEKTQKLVLTDFWAFLNCAAIRSVRLAFIIV